MNTRGLLDQLLRSGQEMLQNKAGTASGEHGKAAQGGLGGLLGGQSGGQSGASAGC